MKHFATIVSVAVALSVAGCHHLSERKAVAEGSMKVPTQDALRPEGDRTSSVIVQIEDLMDAGNYAAAEVLVDQEIGIPEYCSTLHWFKAQLLAKRGADAEALDKYMSLVREKYGTWSPSPENLRVPFDLAVELNRTSDLDEIATEILANRADAFGDVPSLQTPLEAETSTKRIAYAYLALALAVTRANDLNQAISYCQSARSLLPNDTIVLTRLAVALHERATEEDEVLCRSLLSQVYQQEPIGSERRTAAQDYANQYGMGPLP